MPLHQQRLVNVPGNLVVTEELFATCLLITIGYTIVLDAFSSSPFQPLRIKTLLKTRHKYGSCITYMPLLWLTQ